MGILSYNNRLAYNKWWHQCICKSVLSKVIIMHMSHLSTLWVCNHVLFSLDLAFVQQATNLSL